MNMIEQQMKMARELMELNTEWFRKIAEYDTQNFQSYVQMNQEFAQRLPEVRDMQSFVDLQREYGETLWNSTREVFQARGEMLREAAEANGAVWREAFSNVAEAVSDAAEDVAEEVKGKKTTKVA